jgi:hypothetical protein
MKMKRGITTMIKIPMTKKVKKEAPKNDLPDGEWKPDRVYPDHIMVGKEPDGWHALLIGPSRAYVSFQRRSDRDALLTGLREAIEAELKNKCLTA